MPFEPEDNQRQTPEEHLHPDSSLTNLDIFAGSQSRPVPTQPQPQARNIGAFAQPGRANAIRLELAGEKNRTLKISRGGAVADPSPTSAPPDALPIAHHESQEYPAIRREDTPANASPSPFVYTRAANPTIGVAPLPTEQPVATPKRRPEPKPVTVEPAFSLDAPPTRLSVNSARPKTTNLNITQLDIERPAPTTPSPRAQNQPASAPPPSPAVIPAPAHKPKITKPAVLSAAERERIRKAKLHQAQEAKYTKLQADYAAISAKLEKEQAALAQEMQGLALTYEQQQAIYEKQMAVYRRQQALFNFQQALYELYESGRLDPEAEIEFPNVDEAPEKRTGYWANVLGPGGSSTIKKRYALPDRQQEMLERMIDKVEREEHWRKEWQEWHHSSPIWQRYRVTLAFTIIAVVSVVVFILNTNNFGLFVGQQYDPPCRVLHSDELLWGKHKQYKHLYAGSQLPVGCEMMTKRKGRNVLAMRGGATVRLDRQTSLKLQYVGTNDDESAQASVLLNNGRVFIYTTPESRVRAETIIARVEPDKTQPCSFALSYERDPKGKPFSRISVFSGQLRASTASGRLYSIDIPAGHLVKFYDGAPGTLLPLGRSDSWLSWNQRWSTIEEFPQDRPAGQADKKKAAPASQAKSAASAKAKKNAPPKKAKAPAKKS